MQNKLLLTVLLVFTLAVVAVMVVLFKDSGSGEGLLESDMPALSGDEQVVLDDESGKQSGRETLAPIRKEEPREPGAMPDSYRRALGVIKGRVVEPDLTPVAGMKVEIFGLSALEIFQDIETFMAEETVPIELRTGSTTTAADGTFRLADLYPRAIHVLGLDLGGARPTIRVIDAAPNPGETVDLGDIVLKPRAVLTGIVVDDTGEPVAGARIRATDLPPVIFISGMQDFREGCSFLLQWSSQTRIFDIPPGWMKYMRLLPVPTTMSAADGSFRLEGVPLAMVTVIADKAGLVTNKKGPIPAAKGGEKDIGKIVMDRGVLLEGKVLDSFGAPAAGIEVRLGPMYGVAEFIVLQPPVFTDDEGAFVFVGAAPLATYAAARRFPEDPWTVVGPFDPEFEPPTLTLPPAYDLRIIVLGADGAPVADPLLKIKRGGDFMDVNPFHLPIVPRARMETPEKGVIDVKSLAPAEYDLLVTAPGYGVAKESVTVTAEAIRKEVVLEPAFEARVRVLTEKKKEPVEWAEVHAFMGEDAWWFNPLNLSRSRTNESGLAVFRNLGPGSYKVNVSHPQYAVTMGDLEVPSEGEAVVLVKPGGIVEGVVHSGGSTDEAPYMVALSLNKSESGPESQTPRLTATDHEGKFRVTNLNPGNWDVNVMKRVLDQDPLGLGEVMRRGPLMSSEVEVWSGETSFIELNLGAREIGPGAVVSGRVFVNGSPAQGAIVGVWAKRRYEGTVDASGRYDLGKVPVGEHSLRINNLPGTMAEHANAIRRRITVEENIPLDVSFEFSTGSIRGSVVAQSDGNAFRGIRVSARLEGGEEQQDNINVSAVTGLDGTFLLEGVPAGTYTLNAENREFGCPPAKGVQVFPGGRAGPVVLTMVTPVLVRGTVVLPEGASESRWLGILIEPADEESAGREWTSVSSKTGAFETRKLIPGSYKATFYGDFPGEFEPMEFRVPPGGLSNLVLKLETKKSSGE